MILPSILSDVVLKKRRRGFVDIRATPAPIETYQPVGNPIEHRGRGRCLRESVCGGWTDFFREFSLLGRTAGLSPTAILLITLGAQPSCSSQVSCLA